MKLPQAPALPQVALQSTPRLPAVGVTVAASVACDPVINVVGNDGAARLTTTGVVVMMVAIADVDFVGSVVEVAVMVTVPPEGTVAGPVKIAGAPLAVCALICPQLVEPQLNLQSTPAEALSWVTVARNWAVRLAPVVET